MQHACTFAKMLGMNERTYSHSCSVLARTTGKNFIYRSVCFKHRVEPAYAAENSGQLV